MFVEIMLLFMLSLEFWWIGILTYIPFHLMHLVIWRINPPRRDALELVAYLIVLPLAIGLLWIGFGGSLPWSAAFLHMLIAANYIAIYPAFQASSPTVHVVCMLWDNKDGVPAAHVEKSIGDVTHLDHRVSDLQRSGMLVQTPTGWELSRQGKILAFFFITYRRWLGLAQGAG